MPPRRAPRPWRDRLSPSGDRRFPWRDRLSRLAVPASRLKWFSLLGIATLALGGCASLYPPQPVTEQGRDIHELYNIVFLFAAAIFLAVEGALLYIVLRYRRRGEPDDLLPEQTHGHTGVEILWTLIPFVIVAFLFLVSWQALGRVVADTAQEAGVRVKVTAFQWCWKYEYLDEGVTVNPPTNSRGDNCRDEAGNPPTLVVPVGERIRLQLHSNDVIHAFYVPQFLSKLDVVPHSKEDERLDNVFDFTPFAIGEYRGQCAEFCGLFHAEMQLAVSVRSQADYEAWLAEEKSKPSPTPQATPPPGAIVIGADPVQKYDRDRLEAPADTPFVIAFDNRDIGQSHNVSIQDAAGTLIFNGDPIVTGPAQATYNVAEGLASGTYRFFCIVHPTIMFGTLEVK